MHQGLHLSDARYKELRTLLALAIGQGSPFIAGILGIPETLPQGTTIAVTHGDLTEYNLWFDAGGAQNVFTFDPTPVPGQIQVLKIYFGNGAANPLIIHASGGWQAEVPDTPGTFTLADGQTSFAKTGTLIYQFQSVGLWGIVASYG